MPKSGTGRIVKIILQSPFSGRWKGKPLFERSTKESPVFFRLIGEHFSDPGEWLNISTFAPETQGVHAAQTVQKGHGALGKIFRASRGKAYRKFQDEKKPRILKLLWLLGVLA